MVSVISAAVILTTSARERRNWRKEALGNPLQLSDEEDYRTQT